MLNLHRMFHIRRGFFLILLTLGMSSFGFARDSVKKDPTGATFAKSQTERLAEIEQLLAKILAAKPPRTVENTLQPYRQMSSILGNAFSEASLFSNVHPEAKIRDAAFQNLQELSKFANEKIRLNRSLYDALVAVKLENPDPELKRYYDDLIRDYKRSGVDRDQKTREKIAKILDEVTAASQVFSKNLREDVRSLEVKPDELKGLPEDYAKPRLQKNGLVKITTDYPDTAPIFNYADSAKLRRELYTLVRGRGYPLNEEPLKQLLEKRHELAQVLGYANWAEYATEDKMAQNPQTVAAFIDDVSAKAKARAMKEYDQLLVEKKKFDADAKKVFEWERSYLTNHYKKNQLDFDPQEIRPYFAFKQVQDGVFKISEKLFGIEIRQVNGAKTWHPDVTVYDVFDGKKLLGRFYLDLHPRENKFKHAAQFTYRSGYKGIQLPEGVLVCNFPQPAPNDPALMEHSQVETYLHEFGHLLHSIFKGHNQWPSSLEWDFIEAPSQLLEEWVWDQEALNLFAKNVKTGKLLSKEQIAKMNKAKKVGLGIDTVTQLHYAKLSLELYNQDPKGLNVMALNRSVKKQYSPFEFTEGTYFPYNFGHLTGYASNYYTYLWSSVIAKDMFSRFEKAGIFSREIANLYRSTVLEATGRKGANDLVKDFLGRPFNAEAFNSWLTTDL